VTQDVEDTIPKLGKRMRTAFAAACAERVHIVYLNGVDEPSRFGIECIELAWAYACRESVDLDDVRSRIENLDDTLSSITERDGRHAWYAMLAVFHALNSVLDDTHESAIRAGHCSEDAPSFTNDAPEETKIEERKWQLDALKKALGTPRDQITRNMFGTQDFARVAPEEDLPKWYHRWQSYEGGIG
jgi:hypothetical protein